MSQISVSQFEAKLIGKTHWIDVRAPVEYLAGAIPGAANLPLLTNEERHIVGLTYEEKGQPAAIALGHELVSGAIREDRVNFWINEIKNNSNSVIYCFRGGMRSQITQKWLNKKGVDCPIINGGYKA